MMKVLGVDPGTLVTGYGIVEFHAGAPARHVAHGVVRTDPKAPLWERLAQIAAAIGALATEHRPDALSLEQCFVSKNVQSALKLGHTRGAIMVTATTLGASIHEYTPGQIKSAVTGNGRAEKHQVAEMVRVILGLPAAPAFDAADALAAAICHGHGRATHLTLRAAPSRAAALRVSK
ncbi:MAG: crossover junction endodeoxyribonuclease RuvC [Deltaproteobacteria bacterium]|nr:crossover junction endodeoxyribonuclease RuvC [Deltaproteobacteria bacterium]